MPSVNNTLMKKISRDKEVSENTKVSYISRLKRIYKLLEPTKTFKTLTFVHKNPRKIITTINDSDIPVNTKVALYSALLSTYSVNDKKQNGLKEYKKEFVKLSQKGKDEFKKQIKTTQQDANWTSHDDLLKILSQIEEPKDFLIFSLFSLLPPRRAIDYASMLVDETDDKKNNYFLTKDNKFDKFIFNTYKGSSVKGPQVFDRIYMENLPDGEMILTILDSWTNTNKSRFFVGKSYTPNAMSKAVKVLMKKYVNKDLTINILRHIYVTWFLDTKVGRFISDKEKVGDFMAHNLTTQELYRKK